ncbi:MAG: coenzyme F420 hydrogenase/dehydrogenase beta subunit N-terminal domain-containing protein, partial [Syntrophobacteraceae bacterium]
MQVYSEKIREAAKRLLSEKRVDAVIGFRRGTVPFMNEPFLAKTPEQADQFVWDGNCGINLANYLPKRTGNIAIAAKGCDSRSIVIHLLENQIKREQLYILGIPCQAMTDKSKIQEKLNGRQILQAEDTGDRVRVSGRDFEQTFERADFLQQNCAICTHKNPVIYDELLGEPVKEQEIDRYEDIRKIESMLSEEKRL